MFWTIRGQSRLPEGLTLDAWWLVYVDGLTWLMLTSADWLQTDAD
jgi:hypothetical protein